MEKILKLIHMEEKKKGRGEDSDPIFLHFDNSIFLGVFDGMGGAGGAECESDFSHDGVHMTKAYVASRIVKSGLEQAISESPQILIKEDLPNKLLNIINDRYDLEKIHYPSKSKVGLRSTLIKEYPTTLAAICVHKVSDGYHLHSLWAGDSRNYLWYGQGLFQISVDDLKGKPDPLQNLHEDAPLSNCIHSDGSFHINHNQIDMKENERFIVFSATDGCFGYYPSPMDFEKILQDTLRLSENPEEWKINLNSAISKVTADDFSYAIVGVGFKDFKELKSCMIKPSRLVKDYFNKLDYSQKEIKKAEEKIIRLKAGIERNLELLWPKYKEHYLKYISEDEEG